MSTDKPKKLRSPSYPDIPLPKAIDLARTLHDSYRNSSIDRDAAARTLGRSPTSGGTMTMFSALVSYGLVEKPTRGEIRVTDLANAILHPDNHEEYLKSIKEAGTKPAWFEKLMEKFKGVDLPPAEGVESHLSRNGFSPVATKTATRCFRETVEFIRPALNARSDEIDQDEGKKPREAEPPQIPEWEPKVGDFAQCEVAGQLQFAEPQRIRRIQDGHAWFEGSNTGIPISQVTAPEQEHPSEPEQRVPAAGIREIGCISFEGGGSVRITASMDVKTPAALAAARRILEWKDEELKMLAAQD